MEASSKTEEYKMYREIHGRFVSGLAITRTPLFASLNINYWLMQTDFPSNYIQF